MGLSLRYSFESCQAQCLAQRPGTGKLTGWQTHPLMEDQGRSSCVAEVLPFVSTAEPSKSQTRKPKCGKGTHCSRNAYMLVYRLQAREKSLTVQVPGESPGNPACSAVLQVGQEVELCLKSFSGLGSCWSLSALVPGWESWRRPQRDLRTPSNA